MHSSLKRKKINKINEIIESEPSLSDIYEKPSIKLIAKNKKNYKKKKTKISTTQKIIISSVIFFSLFVLFLIIFIYNISYKIIFRNNKRVKKIPYKSKYDYIRFKPTLEKMFNTSFSYHYENSSFRIISKKDCKNCGFFTYYINFLGCLITAISSQNIPIMDVGSYPNIFNQFNPAKKDYNNPWENFFEQPYNLTYQKVKENAKKIENESCSNNNMVPNFKEIFSNKHSINFYHDISYLFMPIKNEIMEEVDNLIIKLFENSKNVLGVLARGTDIVTMKPSGFPIPPLAEKMIKDIKVLNDKNKYDFIFLVTEDIFIINKFKRSFGKKLKFLKNKRIKYNYKGKEYLSVNKKIQDMKYQKNYLINIIILSRCIDIVSARTYGAAAAVILSNGFRNSYFYNLGQYK